MRLLQPWIILALATGWSVMFVVGAGFENVHSFSFAFYSGGTVAMALLFVGALVRSSETSEEEQASK